MKLISRLKECTFEKHLNKDFEKIHREHRPFNADEVSTIGLLYHFSDAETDKLINDFVNELKENAREVRVLGYFKEKALPVNYKQTMNGPIMISKNLNWFRKPVAPFVKSFCDEEFDLLIDLTMEDFQPIIYAGALSRAHFKTGRYTERNAKYYDLMIHTEQVQSLPEFMQHVKHYISKVNR